jgi:hypothetical protein
VEKITSFCSGNHLIVFKDAQAAAKFQHTFEAQFASGEALSLGRDRRETD